MNKQQIKNEIIQLIEKLNLKNGGNFNNIEYHYSLCGNAALVMLDLLPTSNSIEILITDEDFIRISENKDNLNKESYVVLPNNRIYINQYTTLIKGLKKNHSTINNIEELNVCNIVDIINKAKQDNEVLLLDFLKKELQKRYDFHIEQSELFGYILSRINA